jgi:hypothetical protein
MDRTQSDQEEELLVQRVRVAEGINWPDLPLKELPAKKAMIDQFLGQVEDLFFISHSPRCLFMMSSLLSTLMK